MMPDYENEPIVKLGPNYLPANQIIGARRHQMEEEILELERMLGAQLRYQRDQDGRII